MNYVRTDLAETVDVSCRLERQIAFPQKQFSNFILMTSVDSVTMPETNKQKASARTQF